MTSDFSVDMNEYLPLRDVVFNTLRQAILKGELKPGRDFWRSLLQSVWVSAEHRCVRPCVSWSRKAL